MRKLLARLRERMSWPLLCAIGLHWGDWHRQPNFHSHHAVEVWRCSRCSTQIRTRTVSLRRLKRQAEAGANINCGADRP